MNSKLLRRYHYQVYFPDNTGEMCLEFFSQLPEDINPTYHAMHQMVDDESGIIDLPTKSDLLNSSNTLVEFYENLTPDNKPVGTIQKMLVRVPTLSNTKDYSYLVAREGFIVSAWSNDKTDIHRLTRNNNYYRPEDK